MKIVPEDNLLIPKETLWKYMRVLFYWLQWKFSQSIRKWQMNYFKHLCSSTEYRISGVNLLKTPEVFQFKTIVTNKYILYTPDGKEYR